jgi:hypothetical protein
LKVLSSPLAFFVRAVHVLGVCRASRPKSEKTHVFAPFLPLKLPKQPINRGFHGFFQRKNMKAYKRNKLLGARQPEASAVVPAG